MTRSMGLLLLLAVAFVTTAPWTPAPQVEAVDWHMDFPFVAKGSIQCELDCNNGDGGTLYCAEPTFEECCAVIERYCGAGGVAFAGCFDDEIGVLCEDLASAEALR